jgi:hypothetical protein
MASSLLNGHTAAFYIRLLLIECMHTASYHASCCLVVELSDQLVSAASTSDGKLAVGLPHTARS